ncbi:glutamyl-tRNA reductase [Marinilabilia sp.]|uniref:glutamyl-tRNA reductase n=1 Tax=Marinilabilia sp. TaxID=2021252 RepID=UPI0025BF8C7D|nr:glutamyl-tRNA reductase [Marinilabilia sp.]
MIGLIGLSHKTASLVIREYFAFDSNKVNTLSQVIVQSGEIDGVIIVSTCNRTEFYFTTPSRCIKGAIQHIDACLKDYVKADITDQNHFYHFFDKEAVHHLFRLISGLESMVFGEYQIVSQIKKSLSVAQENKTSGTILSRLFTKALEVSKQVRTKTGINQGAFSVSYAAVEKCREHFSDLSGRSILLLGAGETGELVVKNLYKRGCRNITIANRTFSKAEELAHRYNGQPLRIEELSAALKNCDIIITSTSVEHIIKLSKAESFSPGHKIVMIDLGVPRNIDPSLGELPNVKLFNIDHLQKVVLHNEEKKKSYLDTANKIIAIKAGEFDDWLVSRKLSPAIQNMIFSVQEVNMGGLESYGTSLSEEEKELLRSYSRHLTDKMVSRLVKNLKITTANGRKDDIIKAIHQLFE